MELKVGGKFNITARLGKGSFGALYSGNNLKTGDEVAIKFEKADTEIPMLLYEAKIYEKLAGQPGFPNIHWYGVEGEFTCLVMDILGPPVGKLFEFCDEKWSFKTILWIAIQMLHRIEALHGANFLHRDIKPENFLIGSKAKANCVYMIDFGLSKRYQCPKTGKHIKHKSVNGVMGTPRYVSLNAFSKMEQGRADDLEAIGNVLIYFAQGGNLPWISYEDKSNKEQLEFRKRVSNEQLCSGLPNCFLQYMDYVKSLAFDERPNYKLCRIFFEDQNKQYPNDFIFDWHTHREQVLKDKEEAVKMEQQKLLSKKQRKKNIMVNKREQETIQLNKQLEEMHIQRWKHRESKKEALKKQLMSLQAIKMDPKQIQAINRSQKSEKLHEKIQKICWSIEKEKPKKRKKSFMMQSFSDFEGMSDEEPVSQYAPEQIEIKPPKSKSAHKYHSRIKQLNNAITSSDQKQATQGGRRLTRF